MRYPGWYVLLCYFLAWHDPAVAPAAVAAVVTGAPEHEHCASAQASRLLGSFEVVIAWSEIQTRFFGVPAACCSTVPRMDTVPRLKRDVV